MKARTFLGGGLSVWCLFFASQMAADDRQELGRGIAFVEKAVAGFPGVTLKLVFFDESKATLRVVSNPDRAKALGLEEWGRAEKAVAVVNGGYFEVRTLQPSGLEIAKGVRAGEILKRHGGGGLVVKQGRPALVWDEAFQDDPELQEYVQCSPWLVSDGRPWPAPKSPDSEPKNARTFIITDAAGQWAIGTTRGVTLSDLARILITPGVITEFSVKRALNLDGGPSTGLWFKSADGREHYQKPGWAVRNGIAVIPK